MDNFNKYLLFIFFGCLLDVTKVGVDEAKLKAIVFEHCLLIFVEFNTSDFLLEEP